MASIGSATSSPAPVPSAPAAAALRRFLKAREAELRRVVLHVNTQVVYNSEDSTSPFTLYVLKILDNNAASGQRGADDWQVEKRFSECYTFHSKFVKMVGEWEGAVTAGKHEQEEEEDARQRATVLLKTLRYAVKCNFPRKHMRYDTQSIVRERRERLPDFVHTLFTTYTDLMLYFQWYASNAKLAQETASHKLLRGIFSALESFLVVPAKRKEADARMIAAILALDAADRDFSAARSDDLDAEDGAMCCICLGDACDNYGGDDKSEADADAAEQWVTLPCTHQFHETCVISWFRSKTSCPVCRRDPAAASARVAALH